MVTGSQGSDPALLRRINSAAVLKQLHRAGVVTLTELSRSTGLSRRTCEEVITDLLESGWAAEVFPDPDAPRQIGRPARRFRFHAEAGHVLGLDIGAHKILAIAADLRGTTVASHRVELDPELPAADRLAAAAAAITACRSAADVESFTSILVGTTGIVDPKGAVRLSAAIPGWTGLDLKTEITALLPHPDREPVAVENDIVLAAVAERWRGIATDTADVVYLHAGRRMGAGVLIDGKPHRGRHGLAGEIGMLEVLGWEDAYQRFPSTGNQDPVEQAFTAASDGKAEALALVDGFAEDLSRGVAVMTLAVDPEVVVIGGGISKAGEILLGPLRDHLAKLFPFPIPVMASTLGDENVAIGAVRLALNRVEEELFTVG
ncbi:ROK family protein [Streptomyces lavendulocolor]|uniref:ROK family protein n=1 Tax=Streptomyces lavendulocolor TaxID=67316 RepID=UPI003C2EE549